METTHKSGQPHIEMELSHRHLRCSHIIFMVVKSIYRLTMHRFRSIYLDVNGVDDESIHESGADSIEFMTGHDLLNAGTLVSLLQNTQVLEEELRA